VEDTEQDKPGVVDIDLTNELDGNWRDLLRENPNHPAFQTESTEIFLVPVDEEEKKSPAEKPPES
jgi:hypothetical protein